ncbi:hypothetical protein HPB50_018061 [Hyalomma asiaticum]|uniref:Uncharacterized protein n=1 Tax=Hyalomma asiaticum TaxID=266040 RepID=A0ACB7TK40_HYAAI|nr:hypothetical protein HPB50_018061 [Hyalomma asiaticum]
MAPVALTVTIINRRSRNEVRDLLLAPRLENANKALRELLVNRFTPPEPQRLNELLHGTELGDRTPSKLLRHMERLLRAMTSHVDTRLLRELFVQLLANVRMIIASSTDKQLSQLAEFADVVMTAATPSIVRHAHMPVIAYVSTSSRTCGSRYPNSPTR